jgi:hypothetical protein
MAMTSSDQSMTSKPKSSPALASSCIKHMRSQFGAANTSLSDASGNQLDFEVLLNLTVNLTRYGYVTRSRFCFDHTAKLSASGRKWKLFDVKKNEVGSAHLLSSDEVEY